MNALLILVSLFGNLWLYKLFEANIVVALLTLGASFVVVLSFIKNKNAFIVFAIVLLSIVQVSNFHLIGLTDLSNDEKRVQSERLSMYPPERLKIGYYFEQKKEVIAVRRVVNAFIEQTDLNLYFFSGHPRPRIGVDEFEKFPYILLPIFLLGIYETSKRKKIFLFYFLLAIFAVSLNSNKSALGFFILFPFFATTIYSGFVYLYKWLNRFKFSKYFFLIFVIIYILILLQTISYEIYQ